MIGIAVVGFGYWGPNLVRNFAQVDGAEVVAVCDPRGERRAAVEKLYPTITTYEDVTSMLLDARVDAVVIATPISTHFPLGLRALQAGKHLFVEKPFTANVGEAQALIAEAERRDLIIMVDHTFVYTSAVRKMAELLATGDIGELHYYDSVRVNLGLFQSDVSVIWDLAVHDLSIMDFLIRRTPTRVAAVGVSHLANQPENMAYITCFFDDAFMAHFHVNWLAPVKVRQTMLCGSKKMIVFNDIDMSEKIKIYDKGIVFGGDDGTYQRHVGYRTGDMWAPRLDNIEALQVGTAHFVECIRTGTPPRTDGHAGLRVVRILESASRSMELGGQPVAI